MSHSADATGASAAEPNRADPAGSTSAGTPTLATAGSFRRHPRLLAVLLALGVLSTTIHYTHNYLMAEMYPPVPLLFPTPLSYRIGIVVFWPLLTVLALWGYRQYLRGRLERARVALIVYSPLGITTLGHFTGGVPDIPVFFFVTIFTDFATGLAVLIFALMIPRRESRPSAAGAGTGTGA